VVDADENIKSKSRICVGVDSCRGGWLAVIEKLGAALIAQVSPTFDTLFEALPRSARIGIDIPIGLPEKGTRECELQAREQLGRSRMSSVFSAPLRACLQAGSYEDACRIRYRIEGKKMSRQAFEILPKIKEIDDFLDQDKPARSRVAEVHPEVSFATWNDGSPMVNNKKTAAGKAERRALIDREWPGEVNRLRNILRGEDYELDDLHDAFAALWSVRRWVSGQGEVLGDKHAVDVKGLPMRMLV
jgi:predicted RNase H-like nuclease